MAQAQTPTTAASTALITLPQQRNEVEKPFSLAPSIFTPFTGLPSPSSPTKSIPGPLEPSQKLAKIIENLALQHEAVRRNMLGLVQHRAETLARKAREEIVALNAGIVEEEGMGAGGEGEGETKNEIEAMLRRIRVPARRDAQVGEYEIKPGGLEFKTAPSAGAGDGDVRMSGTEEPLFVPERNVRTAAAIRKELSRELRNLVDRAVGEMEAYDRHAAGVSLHYKQALERRTARFSGLGNVVTGVGNGGGGGILKNRNEESPVDREAIRRMSTGMPFPGLGAQAVRTFENIEEVARRGSK